MKITFTTSIFFLSILVLPAQDYLWAKNIGGSQTGANIDAAAVRVDGSGNIITAGRFGGVVDFDPGAGVANMTAVGGHDIFFAKYDASGNFIWVKTIGSAASDICHAMQLDDSNNIYLGGTFGALADFNPGAGVANLSSGNQDAFIAKYDNNGNYIRANSFGNVGTEAIFDLSVDGPGNVYVTGMFQGTVNFGTASVQSLTSAIVTPGSSVFIAKYDAGGNYVWAKQLGLNTEVAYLAVDAAGNVLLTGKFAGTVDFDPDAGIANVDVSGGGNTEIFFAKYTTDGTYVFAKGMGSSGIDGGNGIAVDEAGNIYVKGNFDLTVDFDPGAGNSDLTSTYPDDLFIAKYDAAGNFVWAHNFVNGAPSISPNTITVDNNSDLLITGAFYGTVDFDPGAAVANVISTGNKDIFFAKYDHNGNYLSAEGMGYIYGQDLGMGIASAANGDLILIGTFQDSCDFDPGASVSLLTSAVPFGNDLFLARYTSGPVSIRSLAANSAEITIHPNPSVGLFSIESSKNISSLMVTDIIGNRVGTVQVDDKTAKVVLNSSSPGVYFVTVLAGQERIVRKVCVN